MSTVHVSIRIYQLIKRHRRCITHAVAARFVPSPSARKPSRRSPAPSELKEQREEIRRGDTPLATARYFAPVATSERDERDRIMPRILAARINRCKPA
jgi:hypothetical protein